jgi:hypothetical protein
MTMEKLLKLLKAEAVGGQIIRYSLAGLLLFGGFAKLILIGESHFSFLESIFFASLETLSAIGLIYHFRSPLFGIVGGILALVCIAIRLIYSLSWVKREIIGVSSLWNSMEVIFTTFNNGIFHIVLLFGAAIYCTGNSYKEYVRKRITQPWPK